jgi:PTS system galactitol-specific IIA component
MSSTAAFEDLIRRDLILDGVRYANREEALEKMARLLVRKGYCKEAFVEAILERERVHPSALPMSGHKIAIPHTDADHVKHSALLFARLERPVAFRSMGNPGETLEVSMISMFALKEKKEIGDFLETLLTIYQDERVREAIHLASDAEEIHAILQKHVREQNHR